MSSKAIYPNEAPPPMATAGLLGPDLVYLNGAESCLSLVADHICRHRSATIQREVLLLQRREQAFPSGLPVSRAN